MALRRGKCGKSVGFRGSRVLRHHGKGESGRVNAHEVWGCKLSRTALNWRVKWERKFPLHPRYKQWEFPPLCPTPQRTNLRAIGNIGQPFHSHSLFLDAGQGTANEESHWLMEKAGKCSCAFATTLILQNHSKIGVNYLTQLNQYTFYNYDQACSQDVHSPIWSASKLIVLSWLRRFWIDLNSSHPKSSNIEGAFPKYSSLLYIMYKNKHSGATLSHFSLEVILKFSAALFVHDLVTCRRLRNLILLLNWLEVLLWVNKADHKTASRHLISPSGDEDSIFPVLVDLEMPLLSLQHIAYCPRSKLRLCR